jgi:hypothetical protein
MCGRVITREISGVSTAGYRFTSCLRWSFTLIWGLPAVAM